MNRFRAAQCNAPDGHYAEAYRVNNRFPFADVRDLLPKPPPFDRFMFRFRRSYLVGSTSLPPHTG